jgi:hypothetical protein
MVAAMTSSPGSRRRVWRNGGQVAELLGPVEASFDDGALLVQLRIEHRTPATGAFGCAAGGLVVTLTADEPDRRSRMASRVEGCEYVLSAATASRP